MGKATVLSVLNVAALRIRNNVMMMFDRTQRKILLQRKTLKLFNRNMVDSRIPKLRDLICDGDSILDVGCGGMKQSTFDEVVLKGSYKDIVGVDAHEQSILDRQTDRQTDRRTSFICGEIQNLIFDRRFDVVLLSHVIEHLTFKDADRVIDYLWSICDKQMIVDTPNEFEDGTPYVKESGNTYQHHHCLIDAAFMKRKGFKRVFKYFQPSGYSCSIYTKEKQ